jgi:membrane protein implicated in regulation of membrane protease activity
MSTWLRYLCWQVPGWIVAGLLVAWLAPHLEWPAWAAPAALLGWILKDVALYPLVRTAYERRAPTGAERLVGAGAVAETDLAPWGQVRVRGEIWRARADDDSPVTRGARVVVTRAEGLTLHVRHPE